MAEQTELELSAPAAPADRRGRPAFAGFTRLQILALVLLLGTAIWGMWVTRELLKPRQDRIVAARLSSIVGDYVQAQARSASPPSQVEAEMRNFMASLDAQLERRARKGEVVLVGEAVLTKNVPDITDALHEAVFASGVTLPRQVSAAELQRLQEQAIAAAQSQSQLAGPAPDMMPPAYSGSTGIGEAQGAPALPAAQFGASGRSVSTFGGSADYAGQ